MHSSSKSLPVEAAIIGAACRLPGASGLAAYWQMLKDGRNSVRPRPQGRWSVERFLRPGDPEPGFAYTFAGGYIDNPLGFDPAPFGIAPREAQQMDPQQRLLLEVTWEALEDAMIPPSALAGRNVGVYVGGSTLDYQSGASYDPAVMESHFMTGNSLSILSNRISYAFDFRGPSFTTDSACSSSFVALEQAVAALSRNEVEVAIVGGVNLLLSPAPFIGFSQARMLSQTGLSRPFSRNADGYVRAEGAVVLVLRRLADAEVRGERVRSVIVGAALNSDGRTSGISLPSLEGQRRLIDQVYREAGVDPNDLAFVEAHGTGTRVGDPIEATAIGLSLGKKRNRPLPIGSVKSNIGHLEAASGLAGLMKAVLSLEHGTYPPSLFLNDKNETIDFTELNLAPNETALTIENRAVARFAGVCNYGFGGTNAHVVIRAPKPADRSGVSIVHSHASGATMMLLSAADPNALAALADSYADMCGAGVPAVDIANAVAHGREVMKHRLAVPLSGNREVEAALRDFATGNPASSSHVSGLAQGPAQAPVFVYSGNGSQFAEMGQQAFGQNARFRAEIEDIDRHFLPLSGWSIAQTLGAPIPQERLDLTSVSQPLIYAIQAAISACFAAAGITPRATIGHSVGEVAAAEAAGALTRADAVRLIYLRSKHQERVKGLGRMMVAAAPEADVAALLVQAGATGIEIAAVNSITSTTLSGHAEGLKAFAKTCRSKRIATVALDIDYPFHSSLLDPIAADMIADLGSLRPRATHTPFLSTVTGEEIAGEALDAAYWWNNIRQPVRFADAVELASRMDSTVFVEIGPRAILVGPIAENLRNIGQTPIVLPTFSAKDDNDPVALSIARLIVHGAAFDKEALAGRKMPQKLRLPHYPFQRRDHNLPGTAEAISAYGASLFSEARHPLLGTRMADGSPEWRSLIDPVLVPYLDDHRVDGGVIVPAAGLIEIALAAGKELFGEKPLLLDEFDILKALSIPADEMREVSTRYADATGTIEIWSRKRFSAQEWALNARGKLASFDGVLPQRLEDPVPEQSVIDDARAVYLEATRAGLEYGPKFQLVARCRRDPITGASDLLEPEGGLGAFSERHVLHPASLDATFHGLFASRPQREGEKKAHLPVRFRKIAVFKPGAVARRSLTRRVFESDRFSTVAIQLFDETGDMIASVEAAVLRALYLSKATVADRTFRQELIPVVSASAAVTTAENAGPGAEEATPPAWLVMRAFAVSLSHRLLVRHGLTASASAGEASAQVLEAARTLVAGFGLIDETGLQPECPLPAPEAILATLVTSFPEANLEIRLAAHALSKAESIVETGIVPMPPAWLRDQFDTEGLLAGPALKLLRQALERASETVPLRLLVTGRWSAGLVRAMTPLAETGRIDLTFVGHGEKAFANARLQERIPENAAFLDLETPEALNTPLRYDGIVAVAGTGIINGNGLPADLGTVLADDARLFIVQPGADATLDFLCSLWSGWANGAEQGLDRIPPQDSTLAAINAFGAVSVSVNASAEGVGALITATLPAMSAPALPRAEMAIVAFGEDWLADCAAEHVSHTALNDWLDHRLGEAALPANLVLATDASAISAVDGLARQIDAIRQIADRLATLATPPRVTICCRGALDADARPEATAAGLWGFMRVAINEYPGIDFRLVDFSPKLPLSMMAARLEDALALTGGELELRADENGIQALRIRRGLVDVSAIGEDQRSVLRFEQAGRLDSFVWIKEPRQPPGFGDIEIEVAAVGLNFRDILVGLGILDDDLLGAGLTAASLGFECSGIVVRVGEGVDNVKVGDPVMGFATNAFASHLVSPAWHFFKVPDGVSLEAAATIPVAFGTAWFSLLQRARIAAGDDVLVHGGAGGVGLAAIQFAKEAGARVLATASSDERRAIARAMGAHLTYDSRHERFADAIRSDLGGVDVVLNSLAGAGMHASFKLVKPFGRFVELGKRDYLENTHIGLRPFVRNIAYFGVDLDELLAHDRRLVETMMQDISSRFAAGTLKPLPYRVFEGHEIGQAFRLMQASEHVGKIVIRPSQIAAEDISALSYSARPGVHLIIGGTSGLGFETARWLAGKGAGTIVLASRRGTLEEGLEPELEALRAAGTTVLIEALDVTDRAAVAALVTRLAAENGPVRGVVHAAVLLDDGMISGLTPERLRAVLAPKIAGAENLDAATDHQPLDYFVVYSSATTLIGSPGQGAYVAANAWLEGFARQRRARGKPALAIGWGAISDVGILARDRQLGQRLRRTTGVVGIPSNEALAHLGRLLVLGDRVGPMQFYSNIAPGAAAEKLRLIQSPTFAGLGLTRAGESGEETGDLLSLIEGKSDAEANVIVVQALRREISHILRMPEDQIDISRPLGEMGLDSLMALELQLAIERLCGTEVPMVGASDRRLPDLAASIIAGLGRASKDEPDPNADPGVNLYVALSEQHAPEGITEDEARELGRRLKATAGARRSV